MPTIKPLNRVPEDKVITDELAEGIYYIVHVGNHLKADVIFALLNTRKRLMEELDKQHVRETCNGCSTCELMDDLKGYV